MTASGEELLAQGLEHSDAHLEVAHSREGGREASNRLAGTWMLWLNIG